jgi:hypothetical protein
MEGVEEPLVDHAAWTWEELWNEYDFDGFADFNGTVDSVRQVSSWFEEYEGFVEEYETVYPPPAPRCMGIDL